MLQLAMADGSRSHHQRTIRYCIADAGVLLRSSQQLASADGGTSFPERNFVRVHQAQVGTAEVAHGAGSGTDIQRVARRNQDYAQIIQISRQAPLFYACSRTGLEQVGAGPVVAPETLTLALVRRLSGRLLLAAPPRAQPLTVAPSHFGDRMQPPQPVARSGPQEARTGLPG